MNGDEIMQTVYELVKTGSTWELKLAEAKFLGDIQKAQEIAQKATQDILEKAGELKVGASDEYFKNLKLPTSHD